MPEGPRVSVIVVTYNSRALLEACLSSVCAMAPSPAFEVIVVDNASGDDSHAIAQGFAAHRPFVRAARSPVNRGYAGGVNAALQWARGEYVAVLNPDVIVRPDWLAPLIAFMDARREVGAVNPLIVLHERPEIINAAGQDAHVTGLGFNRALGRPVASLPSLQPVRVSGIQGGAFMIRRALLEAMGGWDESGFLYHEDVELSWLLQLMGYALYCVPASTVAHAYHLTMYPEKLYLLERNRWAMLVTHLGWASLLALAPLLLVTEAMMWGYCLLRGAGFLQAKARSFGWLVSERESLGRRLAHVRALRCVGDFALLRQLAWGYAWDQFVTLGKERGPSTRQPAGGLPVDMARSVNQERNGSPRR